jgi:2-dehydro-3-deoxygluconokinase
VISLDGFEGENVSRFDVATIGEGQLRYSVPAGYRLEDADRLDVHACGTEANVVSLLSRLGWHCGWLSSLPKTALGRRVANQFKLSGLDISSVVWVNDGRIATYYVEYAGPPRCTQVYYDRANTCFTKLDKDDIDWDYLTDARILHLSGLTVPLSPQLSEIVTEAIRLAKSKGVQVSFDVNYRRRIWSPEQARETLLPIIKASDILFCSRSDAQTVLGIEGDPRETVQRLAEFTSAKFIVSSLSQEGLIGWDGDCFLQQPAGEVTIIDRIGAGDAMVAGVLHGLLLADFARGLRYGVIAAALALTQYGDQVITTRDELEEFADRDRSTDIYR